MKAYQAIILSFNTENIMFRIPDLGLVQTTKRLAVPFGSGLINMGGIFKHLEEGDRVIALEDANGEFVILPVAFGTHRVNLENMKIKLIDVAHFIQNFKTQPGDIVVAGNNNNYLILRANGNVIIRSLAARTVWNPSTTYGGWYFEGINFVLKSHVESYNFSLVYDRASGPASIFHVINPPQFTTKGNFIDWMFSTAKKVAYHFTVARATGDVTIKSDTWQVNLQYSGNITVENSAVSVKITNSGEINIEAKTKVSIKANEAKIEASKVELGRGLLNGIVTGYPSGTMPVCYVTGAPIQGSKSCKASS